MELHFPYCKAVMDKQLLLICALTFIIHIIGTLASHAHRRHPHATHRRVAGPVQHSDAAVAHLELVPGTIHGQARGNGHKPACSRQHAIGRLPRAAVLHQPGNHPRRHTDPHLPARPLPRRRPLPSASLRAQTAAARRLQGWLVLPQDLRQPAKARQRHKPAQTIRRLRLHDGHERHRHGPVDGGRLRRTVRRRAGPSVRVTSSTLSSIINGGATIMMAIFIDPHMSGMTDDVIEGKIEESQFRRAVVWLVGSRLTGTLLAQFLLVPSAVMIVGGERIVITKTYQEGKNTHKTNLNTKFQKII